MILLLPVALLLVFAIWFFARRPAADRDWMVDHARPARPEVAGNQLVVRDVRNFRYDSAGNPAPGYYDATYNLDSLDSVWFALTAFSKKSRVPAHTFVSFGFADGRYLAVSIEARRERGEAYGILAGALRQFELIYVMGDERDIIGRRAVVDGDRTYLYPVNATREKIREMLLAMVARAGAVQERPEFYNSFTNNCNSNLVAHVNQVAPGRIPSGFKVLLPGYADDVAHRLGLIADSGDAATVRERYLINQRARGNLGNERFSAIIRGN